MATRKRDYFRLNKQDQTDLRTLLAYDVTIPKALVNLPNAQEAFRRLNKKFWRKLSNG